MLVYQQKVELVLAAWPPTKLKELVTRLIFNTKGTVLQKLQIHQTELLTGEEASVHKLVELLGGQWGRIPLERQYEDAEQAIYHTLQKTDETNDSFLARADILWGRLLSRKITIADLQAYIVLRGSQLTADEKKRVIMDSESTGSLTMKKVSEAIRLLGVSFFRIWLGNGLVNRRCTIKQLSSVTPWMIPTIEILRTRHWWQMTKDMKLNFWTARFRKVTKMHFS